MAFCVPRDFVLVFPSARTALVPCRVPWRNHLSSDPVPCEENRQPWDPMVVGGQRATREWMQETAGKGAADPRKEAVSDFRT